MIVDQFNATTSGGAASAARRLHRALLNANVVSRYWHLDGKRREAAGDAGCGPARWVSSGWSSELLAWPRKKLQKLQLKLSLRGRPDGLEMFSSPQVIPRTRVDVDSMGTDIIHLHWIAKLVDYSSFFMSLPDEFPIVWTLHDMNPFSGGCHYAGTCTAFRHECRNCPQLGHRHANDLSWRYFNQKLTALTGKNLHIVSPSHWLEREARSSRLLGGAQSFQTIHNGLDTDVFRPYDKRDARRQLGLRDDGLVIGFGAETLDNRRKGYREFLRALRQSRTTERITGLAFGNGTIDSSCAGLPEIVSTGFVHDPQKQALIYSAADIFVMPSLEDNLPQTGIEAMACGTPVVAFKAGGIPDYVHHQKTGLLAKLGDTSDLAHHIDWLLAHPQERQRMAEDARALIVSEFHHDTQAAKYISLYQELLPVKSESSLRAA